MTEDAVHGSSREAARRSIVEVAARLLAAQGPAAVTTRGVAQAAGVQAPTIYRLFGDKDGLLDAVAEHVMATYVAGKAQTVDAADDRDAVRDLHRGWDDHVGFGLANPTLFVLLSDPGRRTPSPATVAGLEVLRARVHRVARAGRLRVAEERAVALLQAAGFGTVQTLLGLPDEARDLRLADEMWDAVSRALLTDVPAYASDHPVEAAVAFRTLVPALPGLSTAERGLLTEWLDRAVRSSPGSRPVGR